MDEYDDLIQKLTAAGASDQEIVEILKEKKARAAGASAPVVSAQPPVRKEETLQESATEALDQFGGLFRGAKEGIIKGSQEVINSIAKNNPILPLAGAVGVKPKKVTLFENTKKREGLSPTEEIGEFAGRMIPGMAVSISVAGAVNPVMGPLGKTLLGGVASKATAKLASKTMREALEVGITTIPQEIFAGSIAEAFINPDSFQDWKSTARVAALSSIGSIFNIGGAYMDAIKKANVDELKIIQGQLKEAYDEIADVGRIAPNVPKPQAGPVMEGEGRQIPSAQQVAMGKMFDRELPDPNQLPSHREAAYRRMNEKLQEEAEKRIAAFEKRGPAVVDDPILRAANNPSPIKDPLLEAQVKGVEERLSQQLTLMGGGKGVVTDTRVPLEGVTQPSFLTIEELNDHLRVLNMASISSEPKFKKGQRLTVPRTQLQTAEEIAGRATGGPIKAIDKTIQASFKDIQARLDDASARGISTLDPIEASEVVNELLSMSKRLSRGFEVPYSPKMKAVLSEQPIRQNLTKLNIRGVDTDITPALDRYVEGYDLPTSAKLDDPDFATNQLDPSTKRWITGSDDPQVVDITDMPATPLPPGPPAELPKIEYADAVRNANIDYNKQSNGIGKQVLNKFQNFRREFTSRTFGVGKYDKESGELLQLLSGVPAQADDFVKREMRIAIPDADGKYRGATRKVEGVLFKDLVNGLKADEIVEANAYLKASTLRDAKLSNPKFISDLDDPTINAILDNAPQKIKDFAVGFKVIADALLEDSVNTGYMSASRAAELRSSFYASLGRSFNEAKTTNFSLNRKGSKRTSLPPIDLMQDVIAKTLERNRRNAGFSRLVDAYEANPEAFKAVIQPVDLPSSLDEIPEYKTLLNDFVKDGMTYNEASQMAALQVPLLDQSNGVLRVFRNGKMSLWRMNEDVRRTYEALTPVEFGIIGAITSSMSAPLRTTTSLALDYSGIGPLSDTILTSAKNPNFIPFWHSLEGIYHNIAKTDSYYEMRGAGASFGGRFDSDQLVVYKNGEAKKIANIGSVANHPFKILQALINPISNAARMGDYVVRRRAGESVLQAAMGAKTTLGDFNQVGASMRGWSLVTAFGNVGFQTADAAAELGKHIYREGKKRNFIPLAKAAATFGATITLPTLYFWAAAQKDEELNAYRKSDTGYRNWWFRLPVDVPGIGEAGDIAKMPKLGWWAGQVFGSSFEAYLDGMGDEEKSRLVDGLWSQVGINPIPLAAQQTFGFLTNTRNPLSVGDKIPITPPSQLNLDPSVQGNERTSPLARVLADKAGINPFKTDFLIESGGGSLFGNIIRQLGPNPVELENTDTPLLGRFAVKRGTPTEGSSLFYKDIEQARKYDESVTRALESGDADKARKLQEENAVLITLRKPLEKHVKEIGEVNKFIYTLTMDPQIPAEDKREYINNLRDYQNTLFRAYAEERKSWIELTKQK